MFKVKYKGVTIDGNNIFTVYSVSDDSFLIYINDEPYIKVVGM